MANETTVEDVLEFLKEYRTSKEIRSHFNFSNTEWFRYKRWLLKGGYIEKVVGNSLSSKTNQSYLYIAK